MPYRLVYLGLGALAVAVVILGVVFGRGGEPVIFEPPLESVFPLPGDAVLRQTVVEVDLEVGYSADLYVDGFLVPESEVSFIEGTGVHRWAPSPTGLYLTQWTAGIHRVRVVWDTVAGLPDIGEFEWEFRVQ